MSKGWRIKAVGEFSQANGGEGLRSPIRSN